MARLILKATDTSGLALSLEKFDIVHVTDGMPGACEKWPSFLVVEVEGKTAKELFYLLEPVRGLILDVDGNPRIEMRRQYKFDFSSKITKTTLDAIKVSEDWLIPKVSLIDIGVKS